MVEAAPDHPILGAAIIGLRERSWKQEARRARLPNDARRG